MSSYLPAEINEKKRREADIFYQNLDLETDEQIDMQRKNGRLFIENEPYIKKLAPPTNKELLMLSMTEIENALATPTYDGAEIDMEGNKFLGFAASVTNIEQIKKLYLKIRLLHSAATHIVCSYRIPQGRPFETDDYCKDGDFSCGRTLLKWMQQNQISATAILVVRYTNTKIGQKRFDGYIQAGMTAIQKNPAYEFAALQRDLQAENGQNQKKWRKTGPRAQNRGSTKRQYNPTPSSSQQRSSFGNRRRMIRGRHTNPSRRGDEHTQRKAPELQQQSNKQKKGVIPNEWYNKKDHYFGFSTPQPVLSQDEWPSIPQPNRYRR